MYVPLVSCICDAYNVCLEACDYSELSFVARMTNRHGHTDWVCLTTVCGACLISMSGENTAAVLLRVEHVVEVTAKRRLF